MTTQLLDAQPGPTGPPDGPATRPTGRPARPRPTRSIQVGQLVTSQLAVAALIAGVGHGRLPLVVTVLAAVALLVVTWARWRGRWLFEWLAVGAAYAGRRRRLTGGPAPANLLDFVAPETEVSVAQLAGTAVGLLGDETGLAVVLELGDPGDVVGGTARAVPLPATLLPAVPPDGPPVRLQLLLTGIPAPVADSGAAVAASYRQLTEGHLLGHERVLLAVRVPRSGGWTEPELHRALSTAVRKIRRRLQPLTARPLGDRAVIETLAELAHHDHAEQPTETWSGLFLGGLRQAVFRVDPPAPEQAARLLPRLLALPASVTTLSLTAGPAAEDPGTLAVRLATPSRTALATVGAVMDRLLAAEQLGASRLDGAQLPGLAATLPLGAAMPAAAASRARRPAPAVATPPGVPFGAAGLLLGANRHGGPVTVRLFRSTPTRVVLVGGVRAAQLVTLRALALGARVTVQTARPVAWDSFVRAAAGPGRAVAVIPPGRPAELPVGTPVRPVLLVVDVGAVATGSADGANWQATLVVRDELAAVDLDVLSQADLVVLQPLRPDEAALASSALGLGASAEWLSRIRDDMVAVVTRPSLRWVRLSAGAIEAQLIGPPVPR